MTASPSLPTSACLALLRRFDEGVFALTVTRRHQATVCMPGGKQDPDETPAETAVRETAEETGVCVPKEDLTFVYRGGCPTLESPDYDVSVLVAWWRPEFGEPRTVEAGVSPEWVEVDRYLDRAAFPNFDGRAWEALKHAAPEAF